ncbi:gamma-aminobutyrate permease [Philodulcilactobacillus myokoensis]|uniref:Gamma-aminobutyrate permease n=1 Tax=Philodulcilactobacillus myokoensis TaxID=2929573 RepID=A0A9W6B0X2_9LACO|nr:amino acid permease [Philodulcilactobacillus myokoensis]GLB46593.1 gamma-aminobutyrate permease [Philodulcilactobacillus myokoensis]
MENKEQTPDHSLRRGLKQRYVSMIALGGSIGTGLFVTSGSSISQAGPGGAIVAYIIMGIMVYFLMTSLGEMATNMPVTGSFATYAGKYVDPALGFAMGWNYWFDYAINNAVEISTAAIIMKFWLPGVPGWIWSLTVLLLVFILNILAVGNFGAAEFWISAIKVVTILIFLVVGVLVIFGILGGHATGLSNFTYKKAPFVGGIPSIIGVFVVAGFSFQGTEMIGVTAGESQNPGKSIPKAIHQTFWRILLFYILSIAVIAAILPYTSKYLLGSSITISPFTLIFKRAGLALAASVMNAVILTAVISATNSGMYSSTRMLYSMANNGYAPKFFGRVIKNGIPVYSLIATTVIGLLAFLTSFVGPKIYMWLVDCSSLTGFIAWWGIAISHYRFRRAFVKQGHRLSELKYHAELFPLGPILSLVLCTIVIIAQNPSAFTSWNWYEIGITYISVPLVIILYIVYKIVKHTKLIPLDKVDVKPSTKDHE